MKNKPKEKKEAWENWSPSGKVALKLLLEKQEISPEKTIEYIDNLLRVERERAIRIIKKK